MRYRERSTQIWLGMSFGAWWALLRRNHFAVGPAHIHQALLATLVSAINSYFGYRQRKAFGAQISGTRIAPSPVFIVGHWRSGTTMLHELLACDWRHSFPNTYECFAPQHFLLSEDWGRRHLGFLVPEQRPFDSMSFGWSRPQEDEFALCNFGVPSPNAMIAFPNRAVQDPNGERVGLLPDAERQQWKDALESFFRSVLLRRPGRLIIKSPTHTFRVGVLSDMFPDARFVHVIRDPMAVFASTLRLMRENYRGHALQRFGSIDLEERALSTGERMFRAFLEERDGIPTRHHFDVRFEDMVERPEQTLKSIYRALDLGDFAPARPAVRAYLAGTKGHRAGSYKMSADETARVWDRWGFYYERFGYQRPRTSGRRTPQPC